MVPLRSDPWTNGRFSKCGTREHSDQEQGSVKRRRSLWLWLFSLWVLGLGIANLWRGVVLWQGRRLLLALDTSFAPGSLALFVALWFVCGISLSSAAVGMWLWQAWARRVARIGIVLSVLIFQTYLWFFVRSGLMQQRRPLLLVAGLFTIAIGFGALTWPVSRHRLGLDG